MPPTDRTAGPKPDDAELVRAVWSGDAESLGILLERYRGSLHGLAVQILGHGPQAQDAVQDTFLVALRRIGEVRDPGAVGGWLHTVLRNVCYAQLRRGRPEVVLDEASTIPASPLRQSIEERIDQLALREWVWGALDRLSEPLQLAAMLRYFGSYSSYEEIAAICDVPIGTVRSRLNQARLKLADDLIKTAGLAHDDMAKRTALWHACFEEVFEEANRRARLDRFGELLAPGAVGLIPRDGLVIPGGRTIAHALQGDFEEGVRTVLTNVVASRDITIAEARFENPPDDPFHCPPGYSLICFHSGGAIDRIILHRAARQSLPPGSS